jgi:hypothetical protein
VPAPPPPVVVAPVVVPVVPDAGLPVEPVPPPVAAPPVVGRHGGHSKRGHAETGEGAAPAHADPPGHAEGTPMTTSFD